ncbi:MAG TPA: hypothetical protein DEF51_29845 [Myxococcales bacterium]|nr:hypothetical protein [Myxococcales bacterium]
MLAMSAFAATASADRRLHVVDAGESLGALAVRYHVSVDDLRRWNALSGDTIQVGQELVVEEGPVLRYTTVPGDTLGCIATRFGVPVERIVTDNEGVSPQRLDVGRELVLRGGTDPRAGERDAPPAVVHVVAAGETLSHVARAHDVEIAEILAHNPGLDPDRVRIGRELSIRPGPESASLGAPNCGAIRGGVQVGEHPAYVLRNPERAWATRSTQRRLRSAFDVVHRRHPRAPRVRVHDLSLEGGGPIDDHRSHQSGRDVDITYFQRRGCDARDGCPLTRVDPGDLDVRRQWTLLHRWLRGDQAEAIYVDYALQAPLHREARRRGATAAQLARWFQYPRGRWHADGVVRHFPNHRDHLHVRFSCDGEERCR